MFCVVFGHLSSSGQVSSQLVFISLADTIFRCTVPDRRRVDRIFPIITVPTQDFIQSLLCSQVFPKNSPSTRYELLKFSRTAARIMCPCTMSVLSAQIATEQPRALVLAGIMRRLPFTREVGVLWQHFVQDLEIRDQGQGMPFFADAAS